MLSLLLLVVVAGFYLNKAGLPEFVKKRIVAQLHAKGWDVEFSRLRLRWYRGIVAEDLHLRRTNAFNSPHIFVAEAECHLNHTAFKRLEWEIDAVGLKGGRILWMLSDTNQSHASFQMDAVAGELRFQPGDEWELRSLNAQLLGTQVQLSGTLTNASWIRDWKFPKRAPQSPEKAESKWHKIVTTLDKLQLTGSPRLVVHFQGDAREFKSFTADLNYTVPALKSPWGSGTNVLLTARLFPSINSNDWVQADLKLTAKEASLPWGETTAQSLQLQMKTEPPYDPPLLTRAQVVLDLRAAETRWGKAVRLITSARLGPCATNAALAQADVVTTIQKFESAWGEAANGQIALTAVHAPTNFLPALVSGKAEVDQATSPQGNEPEKFTFATSTLP